jgi:hypothetical protein
VQVVHLADKNRLQSLQSIALRRELCVEVGDRIALLVEKRGQFVDVDLHFVHRRRQRVDGVLGMQLGRVIDLAQQTKVTQRQTADKDDDRTSTNDIQKNTHVHFLIS